MKHSLEATERNIAKVEAFAAAYGERISDEYDIRCNGEWLVVKMNPRNKPMPVIRIDLSATHDAYFLFAVIRQSFEAGRNAKAAEICAALNIPAERMEKADG